MPWSVKSQAACLPVSALRLARVNEDWLLFVGQGPHLNVYDQHGFRRFSVQVFQAQPIHGILTRSDTASPSNEHAQHVIIWGGVFVRVGRLTTIFAENASPQAFRTQMQFADEFKARDWIIDAVFAGSSISMLTAHNVLLNFHIIEKGPKISLDTENVQVIHGPGSFLYSGNLCVATPDLIIVAAGTVFGNVLVWTCSQSGTGQERPVSVKHVFNGHRGSVFGVSISEQFNRVDKPTRLLASCSDDRTIRLWDISDREDSSRGLDHHATTTATGFSDAEEGEKFELASAWGHASRIWGVQFVPNIANDPGSDLLIVSRGEDAVCQLWSTETSQQGCLHLRPLCSDRHHVGKNAWSMSLETDGQCLTVVTGGADGQVILRPFDLLNTSKEFSVTLSKAFTEITNTSQALKQYLPIKRDACLATTDQGDLYQVVLQDGELGWTHLYKSSTRGGLLLCKAAALGVVLVAQQRGDLFALRLDGGNDLLPITLPLSAGISWMRVASPNGSLAPTTCIVASLGNKEALIIWLVWQGDSLEAKHTVLRLPNTFVLTACCYDEAKHILLLGSRAGALAVYPDVTSNLGMVEEPLCLRHVHGTDSVTSITILESSPARRALKDELHILTTGRDGTYAIHGLDVHHLALSTVHISSAALGPNIEGAYLVLSGASPVSDTYDLILYGFRSTSFVVWNETQQSTVLSVECGGAHRTWAYDHSSVSTYGAKTDLSAPTSASERCAESFIWTKAGRFNWHRTRGPGHTVIQTGGHGREVKAIAHSPRHVSGAALIATGAEDTNIRLFAVSSQQQYTSSLPEPRHQAYNNVTQSNPVFHSIATLKRHTTGLQHIMFSSSGEYLFSSAGFEEFYVWKITFDVPFIGVGAVLWDMMPKGADDSDARIMSFDLREEPRQSDASLHHDQEHSRPRECFMLALAYSNGKTKVLRYTPSTARKQGTFETLQEITHGSFCVMQAFFLPSPVQRRIVSAGTNGFLNISCLDSSMVFDPSNTDSRVLSTSAVMEVHKIHQSSVLSMDITALGSTMHFIATGGDDNAMGLTLLTTRPASNMTNGPDTDCCETYHQHVRTIVIPKAHAAAVTGLKIVGVTPTSEGHNLTVVTAGNDQRVNVWKVHIGLDHAASSINQPSSTQRDNNKLLEDIEVQRAGSAWTGVADVSGVEVVQDHVAGQTVLLPQEERRVAGESGNACKIMVVGVGMELFSVRW
ncbi:WD repeat-containing protein 6 [Exophiala xenobiotica]|nr:WD repeat-containing protein 6 [Exophiala xenobiotica]